MSLVLVLPHIHVQNANAHSSPYSVGFPSLTAWLGSMHYLQREISRLKEFSTMRFVGVGIVCHDFSMHSYKDRGKYVASLIGTSNPLDKNGKRPSFIEEAKCSLEVSLIIQVENLDLVFEEECIGSVQRILMGKMKIASGDVVDAGIPRFEHVDEDSFSRLMNSLMPGYVLVERRALMQEAMATSSQTDAMDALLEYVKVLNVCIQDGSEVEWIRKRKTQGWIVPIAVGYQAITGFIDSPGRRDTSVPHKFVESIVTLGEFKMAYRCKQLSDVLWRYHASPEADLYVCKNEKLIGE